ncbi:helix-turn-helix domain-containing protein [Butyricicoccus porcorum]|uniref:HTH cro/C1-type domain-containing protein n=1 Tax=Butyricicoccus porcorum TaxID=1945634 RepID=A0A252F1I0_9FIRM|nr:helix-turn-helix transcriptional regulator [Butyricicoccus porcorum]OUM19663.1 hypothetical protein CBW42_12105 [Butyricicoccus porcorum]
MPFRYKIDIISALKAAGYSSYIIQTQNLISQRSMQKMRENKMVTLDTLDKICTLLHCHIEDLIEHF